MSEALAAGAARDALHGDVLAGRAHRVHRGVYLVPEAAGTDQLRSERAAQLHLGPESTLVLASAARIHGIQGPLGPRVPQVSVPPGLEKRQRSGIELHFWAIPDEQRCTVGGLTVTTVARTLADLMRLLPRMQAVASLDSALHLGLALPEDVLTVASLMRRRVHCVTGRRHLSEGRLGAQSPLETRVRLRASEGGWAPDALQVPVLDEAGILLGYGDMGYRLPDGTWLIVEADGASVHELPQALLHDRRRQNAFLNAGVRSVIRFA